MDDAAEADEAGGDSTPSGSGDGHAVDDAATRTVGDRVRELLLRLASPPGLLFHGILLGFVLVVLWAYSVPGIILLLLAGWLVLSALAFVWGLRALAFARYRRRSKPARRARWLVLAPVIGALTLGLVSLDVPLKVRWTVSRSSFERVVDDLEESRADATVTWTKVDVPGRIGTYRIHAAYRVEGGYVFYEANGAFLNDAGFAYLPDGPHDDLATGGFESPQFHHLSGPWYTWTASW